MSPAPRRYLRECVALHEFQALICELICYLDVSLTRHFRVSDSVPFSFCMELYKSVPFSKLGPFSLILLAIYLLKGYRFTPQLNLQTAIWLTLPT